MVAGGISLSVLAEAGSFWAQIAWRPRIGDPDAMGWLTVAAYLLTAGWLGWRAVREGDRRFDASGRRRFFWGTLAAGLLLLAVNKQLDLQSLLTDVGRVLARRQGWYDRRQGVQLAFIASVLGVGFLFTLFGGWWIRPIWRSCWISLLGAAVLLTFVGMRAASFHHFDDLLPVRLLGLRFNWLMELGGIGLIALGAWPRHEPPSRNGSASTP